MTVQTIVAIVSGVNNGGSILNSCVSKLTAAVRQITAFQLRPYQADVEQQIYAAWQSGARNVLAVLPTGAGKTVLFAKILADHDGASCAIAHRQELVAQISLALARNHVRHRIIGPQPLIKHVVRLHMRRVGASYYDANSRTAVAGVDTLIRRADKLAAWLATVTKWVQDEAHHILAKNKWGKAADLFPNAIGLGVTATPERADGKGLGRDNDGLMDTMVLGPSLRWMIHEGYLTDYRIFAPPNDMDVDDSMISETTGDFSRPKLAKAAKNSHIVGDVVSHYRRLANGRRGVTFYPDVETASEGAARFRESGVPAEMVSAKTADEVRADAIGKLENKTLWQLTNVDIFGEGFDLPAIDVVSLARHTASFALFCQQVGRALRPVYAEDHPLDTAEQRRAAIAAGPKPIATIIDHVGNVKRHAVARECEFTGSMIIDLCYREWTLERREKRKRREDDDSIPLTTCLNPACFKPYPVVKPRCPYCSEKPLPARRDAPEFVDGDLTELDPSALRVITLEGNRLVGPAQYPEGANPIVRASIHKKHNERLRAQELLRQQIAWWAAWGQQHGWSDAESYRRFFHKFGIDVATAKTLGAKAAAALTEKVILDIARLSQ